MKENTTTKDLSAYTAGRLPSIIVCALLMACASILFTWSIFVNPVVEYHGWDLSQVAYVGTLNSAGYFFGICIGGNIYTKLGPRKTMLLGSLLLGCGVFLSAFVPSSSPMMIYLTYGAIAGTGVGTIYNAAMFGARDWYPENRGLAMGISLAAFGGGGAFIAPVCAKIIGVVGIKSTFMILGIVFLIIGIGGSMLYKPAPEPLLKRADELRAQALAMNTQRNYTLKEAVQTRQFWSHAVGMALRPAMYQVMGSFLVVYGIANGMSDGMATLAVSVCAISQIVTRLGLGVLADKWHWRKVYMHHFLAWIIALLLLVVFRSAGPAAIMIGYIFLASGYCGTSITNPIIDSETFGPRTAPSIFGTALFLGVISTIIIPRIGLVIMNNAGGNLVPMIIFGFVISIIGDLCSFSVTPIKPDKFPESAE